MTDINLKTLGRELINWMYVPENFLVSEFAAENRISRKRLEKFGKEDEDFGEALELAYTIQEVKVAKGALSNQLEKAVALRLLETFHEWKSESKNVSTSEFKVYAESAEKRARDILGKNSLL